MTQHLNYYWRLIATGICFALFGLGGIILSVFVFPVLNALPKKSAIDNKHLSRGASYARWIIHRSFKLLIQLMQYLGIMRCEIIGEHILKECRHTLVLANHPTLLDVVALISFMPAASCVVKQALWKNLFVGLAVRTANYISNAQPEQLIDDCTHDLIQGNALIIFPEGTRSQPKNPLHFLRGAAAVALRSGVPILPVLIDCTPSTLTKQTKWYSIPDRSFSLRLRVLPPISPQTWAEYGPSQTIAVRQLTQYLENHFTNELTRYARTQN
ncbi:MAG: 1-acyl-sn-glycerol-3-phosphate acyltransferase [Ottowia sp.]|jgi:1-acyl-sn-glycerol-3-phosphate acyltransferase|nr:1-acyl-sn-glycerol-3-phosphate acyltransferase [Ottowia sp.]